MRFRDREYGEFYDAQQRESGYPGALLPPVIEILNDYKTVLDIGAGTGFFTIPLLEQEHLVTAIEPATGMSAIILKKCPAEKKRNLTIINDDWENWNGTGHDAAICVHSFYPMKDRRKCIEQMCTYASKRIIIVRESSEMITLSGQVRSRLGIELTRDYNDEIKAVLKSLDAGYEQRKIVEQRTHRINDIDHETDFIMFQLRLEESSREKIKSLIIELCDEAEQGYIFNANYSDNLYIF